MGTPEQLSGVLLCGLRRALRQQPIVKSARRRLERMGLIERGGFNAFSKLTERGLSALLEATTPRHPGADEGEK